MKTSWIVIVLGAISAVNGAHGFDIAPPHGMCALGRIAELRLVEPNRWLIEISDVKVLLQSSAFARARSRETLLQHPTEVTLDILTGLGGVLVSPEPEWVGRLALFSAIEGNGIFGVPNLASPLSPNGTSFAVIASDQTQTINAIEHIARILNLTNFVDQQQQLIAFVESSAEPLFLRRCSMQQLARIGRAEPDLHPDTRTQLLKWRNHEQLIPELRVYADEVLVDTSPRTYQWSEERLIFLRGLKEAPDMSPEVRHKLTRCLSNAERLKSLAEPAKQ